MPQRLEYKCGELRPLTSDSVRGMLFAARIFGNRLARQTYGRTGKLMELEQQPIESRQDSKSRIYYFTGTIGANGRRRQVIQFPVTQTRLPDFDRGSAIKSAAQLAGDTGMDWIAFCLNDAWDRIAQTSFRHRRNTPGLSEAVRVKPDGSTHKMFR